MRFLSALLLTAAMLAGQDARDALNRGVQAFKNARYSEAAAQFREAVDLDPSFPTARLYLATALMQQYIPGADSPENEALWSRAEAEFQTVLELSPNNATALSSLATLNFNAKRWDAARNWCKELANVEPQNAQAYYSLGVIAWSEWYPDYAKARAAAGLKAADPGPIPDAAIRTSLRARYWSALEDGIWNLKEALSLDPKSSDAMAYMNLIVRERADLRETKEEYQRDTAEAGEWVRKALELKKAGSDFSRLVAGPPPPPRPPATSAIAVPARIRVSAEVQENNLIHRVDPVYPSEAKNVHIQGTVTLSAVIDKEGHVSDLRLTSGPPLLVEAALSAVQQWVYNPTLLNGEPMEVQTIIHVNFTLPTDPSAPRIKVGDGVKSAKLIRQPRPVYPPEAKNAGIQGVVRLSATIDEEGYVTDLSVVSGHPLLVPAALDAVRQWIYEPTLLEGEPVAVKTQIDVSFTLNQ